MGRFEGGGDSSGRFDSGDRFDRVRRIRGDNATEMGQDDDVQREGSRREHNQEENSEIVQRRRRREETDQNDRPQREQSQEERPHGDQRRHHTEEREEQGGDYNSHPYREQRIYREPVERTDSLEDLKSRLDHLLMGYFREMRDQGFSGENKELFLNVFDRLSRREKHIYVNHIVEYLQGKCKKADAFKELLDDMKGIDKLEVYAGLSNACRDDDSGDDDREYRGERMHRREQREYDDEPLSFEISGGTITKNVITLGHGIKSEEKTFSITGGDVESLGDNMFRIDLEGKRRIGSYGVGGTHETLVIGFSGRNTIEIYDSQGERKLGIVHMRNSGENFRRGGREKNISFEIGGTEISLDLIIDRR